MNLRREEEIIRCTSIIHRPNKIIPSTAIPLNSKIIKILKNQVTNIYFPYPHTAIRRKFTQEDIGKICMPIAVIHNYGNTGILIYIKNSGYKIVGKKCLHKLPENILKELPKWDNKIKENKCKWYTSLK